jgi:hypothetical protein
MSLNTCPIAIVKASVEQVWGLLADPAHYALWWDAETCSIIPDGPAQPGQRILAQTSALGRRWKVDIAVQAVAPATRQIDLLTHLPWGIVVHNHIACAALNPSETRVSFG